MKQALQIACYALANNSDEACRVFESMSAQAQKKFKIGLLILLGSFIVIPTTWALYQKHKPKTVPVRRAELYDPQGDVEKYLKEKKISIAEVQSFLDNDEQGVRLQSGFLYDNKVLKLIDMNPELQMTILGYMHAVGLLDQIARNKDVPRAILVRLPVKD